MGLELNRVAVGNAIADDLGALNENAGAIEAAVDPNTAHRGVVAGNPHQVTKTEVGLGSADNTADADKPVSTAQQAALDGKVDKVTGKALSANDFTDALKGKLDEIEAGAEANDMSEAQAGELIGGGSTDLHKHDGRYYTVAEMDAALALKEALANKVTAFQTTPDDTHYPTEKLVKDTTDALDTRVTLLEGTSPVTSWEDVQTIVRAGRASAYFPVGSQFEAEYDSTVVTWDVIGVDHDTPTSGSYTHSLTLQAHDCLINAQFSAPQAMYNAETELAAGTYIFTTNGNQYTFESTQAVPAGGVIFIKTRSDYVPLTLTIYDADRDTVIEDDIAVSATSGTDNLSPINDHVRMRYGSNAYVTSGIRQFLNSDDAVFAWTPQGLYDMPSSYTGTGGFLYQLDSDLAAVLGAADKQVAQAAYDGGGQDEFSDKVFFLSRVETGLGTEGVTTGESVYDFYDGVSNADRIKLLSGSPRYWWLRSPNVGNTHYPRFVCTGGSLYNTSAISSFGLAPACVII